MAKLSKTITSSDLEILSDDKLAILHKKCKLINSIQKQVRVKQIIFQNIDIQGGHQLYSRQWIIFSTIFGFLLCLWAARIMLIPIENDDFFIF